jgi:hypothetical protein
MGSEPYYVFRFKVARLEGSEILPVKDEQLETQIDRRQLGWVWKRIWKPMLGEGMKIDAPSDRKKW